MLFRPHHRACLSPAFMLFIDTYSCFVDLLNPPSQLRKEGCKKKVGKALNWSFQLSEDIVRFSARSLTSLLFVFSYPTQRRRTLLYSVTLYALSHLVIQAPPFFYFCLTLQGCSDSHLVFSHRVSTRRRWRPESKTDRSLLFCCLNITDLQVDC